MKTQFYLFSTTASTYVYLLLKLAYLPNKYIYMYNANKLFFSLFVFFSSDYLVGQLGLENQIQNEMK